MALTKEQIKEFKAEEKEAEEAYNLIDVANNIAEAGDKDWAKKIYKKAEKRLRIVLILLVLPTVFMKI